MDKHLQIVLGTRIKALRAALGLSQEKFALQIGMERTDEDHKLSQEQIRSILAKDYLMEVDRKTIKRTLNL